MTTEQKCIFNRLNVDSERPMLHNAARYSDTHLLLGHGVKQTSLKLNNQLISSVHRHLGAGCGGSAWQSCPIGWMDYMKHKMEDRTMWFKLIIWLVSSSSQQPHEEHVTFRLKLVEKESDYNRFIIFRLKKVWHFEIKTELTFWDLNWINILHTFRLNTHPNHQIKTGLYEY